MSPQQETNKEVQRCFAFEDNEEALSCLKEMIRDLPSDVGCPPKLILLTQEGCDFCAEERKRFKADIDSGLVQELDIGSPSGRDIAKRNGIDFTPAVLLLDCEGNLINPESG